MFADFLEAFGTIDVLVNNAGIGRTRDPDQQMLLTTIDLTDDDWQTMIATHLDATFYCTREALKVMIPKRSGRIINQGSIAGTARLPFVANYCAAKGGVIAFTKSVALEVAKYNVLVNAIAPGFIWDSDDRPDATAGARMGDPEHSAWPLWRAPRHCCSGALPGLR